LPRGRRHYLILAKHSFSRSSSKRTCDSMALCNATAPLLNNSPEAFLSKFSFHSRIACLISLCACAVALRYVCMQASADEHVWHSCHCRSWTVWGSGVSAARRRWRPDHPVDRPGGSRSGCFGAIEEDIALSAGLVAASLTR
jgi:hypothetical protein